MMIKAYDDYGNVVDTVEWEKQIRYDERRKTIDELESRLLSNCSVRYEDGDGVIVIRMDIMEFILKYMKDKQKMSDKKMVYQENTHEGYENLANAIVTSYIEDFKRLPGMLQSKDPRTRMEGLKIIDEIKTERFLKNPILDYYSIDIKEILRKEVNLC